MKLSYGRLVFLSRPASARYVREFSVNDRDCVLNNFYINLNDRVAMRLM
jgi:hypothetical protein